MSTEDDPTAAEKFRQLVIRAGKETTDAAKTLIAGGLTESDAVLTAAIMWGRDGLRPPARDV